MRFKYTISLEMEVEFDAPLLGTDTTGRRRGQADSIAKKSLQEMISIKSSVVEINREIDLDNLKGTIKGIKHLGSSPKNKN